MRKGGFWDKIAEYFDSIWYYSLQGKMAVCSFVMGCIISCLCLFKIPPLGEIATSAITIVSMFLVLAGALVGVKVAFDTQAQKFSAQIAELVGKVEEKRGKRQGAEGEQPQELEE